MYFGSNKIGIPKTLYAAVTAVWLGGVGIGIYIGYKVPRDVEVESTRPISLSYEIAPDAVSQMYLKISADLKEMCNEPAEEAE